MIEDLWDEVTNPDRIPHWFMPVSGDLEPGGRHQLEGNAGGVIEICIVGSSEALGEAAVAGGEDPDAARRRSTRRGGWGWMRGWPGSGAHVLPSVCSDG